ncbi:hypothetical protein BZM26_02640 [Paraburkholderia strydomiana]|nr:hypothetical protein BZM26_02640 [Paraburkholderia strydomiana]
MTATIQTSALTKMTRAQAKAAGLTRYFTGKPCPHGHIFERHASNGTCVECTSQKTEKRRANPDKASCDNEKTRVRMAELRRADPGPTREMNAAIEWRKATGAKRMPPLYKLEQKAMQAVYSGLFGYKEFKQEVDHLVPKKAKGTLDGKVKVVAMGLHTFANLGPLVATVNKKKRGYFNPELERSQRPANRYPGGAFDPQPSPEEWDNMLLLETKYGLMIEHSLRHLRNSLDRQARAYEKYLRETLGIEIFVDLAWYECRVLPDMNPWEPLVDLGIGEEAAEKTLQAFMRIVSHERLQMQSENGL